MLYMSIQKDMWCGIYLTFLPCRTSTLYLQINDNSCFMVQGSRPQQALVTVGWLDTGQMYFMSNCLLSSKLYWTQRHWIVTIITGNDPKTVYLLVYHKLTFCLWCFYELFDFKIVFVESHVLVSGSVIVQYMYF